jgi:uracil-DNA glycosylase
MWNIGSWDKILKDESFEDLKKEIGKQYKAEIDSGKKIYPEEGSIFKALELNYKKVRVVILGQDPYPDDNAMGLAFSSMQEKIPHSLRNIYKKLKKEIPKFNIPYHANLTEWAKQGVLLLNTVLTVRAGEPKSHRKIIGWEKLTAKIIKQIVLNDNPVVFILWGNEAILQFSKISGRKKEKGYKEYSIGKNKLVLEGPHPAIYGNKFVEEKKCYFSKANEFLGEKAINWQI